MVSSSRFWLPLYVPLLGNKNHHHHSQEYNWCHSVILGALWTLKTLSMKTNLTQDRFKCLLMYQRLEAKFDQSTLTLFFLERFRYQGLTPTLISVIMKELDPGRIETWETVTKLWSCQKCTSVESKVCIYGNVYHRVDHRWRPQYSFSHSDQKQFHSRTLCLEFQIDTYDVYVAI